MGSKKNQNKSQQAKNGNKDYTTFKTVLSYCLMIILCPLVTFWVSKRFLFDDYLQLDTIRSNIFSAVSAVVILHVALGAYIYRAYFEVEAPIHSLKKQE